MHSLVDIAPSKHSVIAGVNALFRMKETARRGPRILQDQFASRLADERLLVQALRYTRFAVPPLGRIVDELQTAHCVRHRTIDELVLRAIDDGFRQVVVVGAGYDMRPTRFAEKIGDARWYELDRRDLIDKKRLKLGRALVRPYETGALELEQDSVVTSLASTSFDPDWDTLFVLEGLVHYLTLPRVKALLGDCAQGRGRRRVVMSFIRSDVYAEPDPRLVFLVRLLDEVPQLHFTPSLLSALCARHKLNRFQSWSYAQQVAAFAPEAEGRSVGATQDVAQVDRAP
jgi:methyltransferase (TIGR00027 family)